MSNERLTVEKLGKVINQIPKEYNKYPIIIGSNEDINNPTETEKENEIIMVTKDGRSYLGIFTETPENTTYIGDYEIKQRLSKTEVSMKPNQFVKVTLNEQGLDYFDTNLSTRLFFIEAEHTCQKNPEKQVLIGRFVDDPEKETEIGKGNDWRINNYQELTEAELDQILQETK